MKNILIFIADGYADYEASYLTSFLHTSNEYNLIFISPKDDYVISKGGLKVETHLNLNDDISSESFEGLILIGGRYYRSIDFYNEKLNTLISSFVVNNKLVSSICDASTYLANNGFLNNVKHTGNGKEYLLNNCKLNYNNNNGYIEKQVVVDKSFITSNGTSGIEFGLAICEYLNVSTSKKRLDFFEYHLKGLYRK